MKSHLVQFQEHARASSFVVVLICGGARVEVVDRDVADLLLAQLALSVVGRAGDTVLCANGLGLAGALLAVF